MTGTQVHWICGGVGLTIMAVTALVWRRRRRSVGRSVGIAAWLDSPAWYLYMAGLAVALLPASLTRLGTKASTETLVAVAVVAAVLCALGGVGAWVAAKRRALTVDWPRQ